MTRSIAATISNTPRAMTSHLIEVLGLDLAAKVLAAADPRTVTRWASGVHVLRREAILIRLGTSYQAIAELEEVLSPRQIRGWFTVSNDAFDYRSALELLDGDDPQLARTRIVKAAAEFVAEYQNEQSNADDGMS
ncbi:hypothetical protein [Gordonia sp. VNK21]|uniref:hypothetical protein n=1 Tax=Gordonia sp. VNK21 TaxID=3382483 RepID=UPI0038D378CB